MANQPAQEPDTTPAEQRFLEAVNALYRKEGGPSEFQQELCNALRIAAETKGESTAQDFKAAIETVLKQDLDVRRTLEKQYGKKCGPVDYDDEIRMPNIEKIMQASGIKSNER